MLPPKPDDTPDLPGLDDDEPDEDEPGDDDPDARNGRTLTRRRRVYLFPAVSRVMKLG